MTFAEKLKNLRRQANMSQEKLAEKLGVSRQAVTKWETDAGIPDIENILAISSLFSISIDELLSNEKFSNKQTDFLYESITEYDIDHTKSYDMKFGGANKLILSGYDGEKIHIRFASNTLSTLQNDFKVKIDDIKNRIDIDVKRKNETSETTAKEAVMIFVKLPNRYIGKIELAVHAQSVEIQSLECESIQLDTRTQNIVLNGVCGTIEINCNLDMNVFCRTLCGSVEINQISSTSKIFIPKGTSFSAAAKGIATKIFYEKNGKQTEDFSNQDADNYIELNGIKSELIICAE
ncbi:MAG: helix-turn-helix domain-containing protein [Acutalibacteraceae bacterium]